MIKFGGAFDSTEWSDREPRRAGKMKDRHDHSKAVDSIDKAESGSNRFMGLLQVVLTLIFVALMIGGVGALFYWTFTTMMA